MRYAQPELVDQLASAYVLGTLGTLGGGARRRFERLRRDRIDVQLAVSQWEERLAQLAHAVPPASPSPRVWAGIEAQTRPQAARARRADPAAPAATPPAARQPGTGGWRWLPAAAGSIVGAAAGVLLCTAVFLAAPAWFMSADQVALRTGEKLPQSYVGLLTDAQGNGKLLVSSLRQGRTMTVKAIGPIDAPPTGHLVLWAVPAGGAPFVLGIVPLAGSTSAQLPDTSEKLLSKVGKLLVTVEATERPAAPSGPAVYAGNCAKLW